MNFRTFSMLAGKVAALGMLDRAIGLISGVVLARWLGVEGYGVFAFVMSVVTLALVPVRFGLPDWLMREIASQRSGEAKDNSIALLYRVSLITGFLGLLVVIIGSAIAPLIIDDPDLVFVMVLGLCLIPFRACLDVFGAALRGWGRAPQSQLVSVLLPSLIALLGILLMWWLMGDGVRPDLALAMRIIGVTTGIVFGWVITRRRLLPHSSGSQMDLPGPKVILKAGFPFMLMAGAFIILSRTDVVMLGIFSGTDTAGVYNVALQGAMLVQIVLHIANTVAAPEFAILYKSRDMVKLEQFAVMSARIIFSIGFLVSLVLISWGTTILGTVFGTEYSTGGSSLKILAIGYAISLFFGAPGYLLNMSGYENTMVRITWISAALNITLNIALIPIWGATGAAFATASILVYQKVSAAVVVRRKLEISCGCFAVSKRFL